MALGAIPSLSRGCIEGSHCSTSVRSNRVSPSDQESGEKSMNVYLWIPLVLTIWAIVGFVIGCGIGKVIRYGQQAPCGFEWEYNRRPMAREASQEGPR